MKKVWKFLSSMGFAVALLVLLAAGCAVSSLVEQGLTQELYAARYGEGTAGLIMALQLDDAYHSAWFAVLSGFLCVNLILCSIIRFPSFLKRFRQEKDPDCVNTAGDLGEIKTAEPEKVFAAMGMPDPAKIQDRGGRETLFASRNRIGVWGAWICHVGVLMLIAGFALGQMTMRETVIWGIPGDVRAFPEAGIEITIDSFHTEIREDASVSQYVTEITVTDLTAGKSEKKAVSVNHPADAGGFRLYQNNTGKAVSATVTCGGKEIQRKTLLPQQGMEESVLGLENQPEYAFYFSGIRIVKPEEGEEQAVYCYDLYRNGTFFESYFFLGEGIVSVGEDEVIFIPETFTLLAARQDRFAPLALAGSMIALIGLALAFLLQPKTLWAICDENGGWVLHGRCRKGQAIMKEQMEEAVRAAEREKTHAER